MNKFIKNIFKYTFLVMFVKSLIIILYFYLDFSVPFIVSKKSFVTSNQILILGNSHPECGINDSLLPIKYRNISISSEPLFYSCSKARYLLKRFHNDTIIIEFTNISPLTTDWVLGDNHLIRNLHKYISFVDKHQLLLLFKSNPLKFIKAILSISIKHLKQKDKIVGGYNKLEREQIADNVVNFDNRWLPNFNQQYFSNRNINFDELIRLIKDFPFTQFYLIRSPMHSSFEYFDENGFKNKVSQIIKNKNVKFIDFAHVINNDSLFADVEHLNFKGANKFTPILLDSIQNKSIISYQNNRVSNYIFRDFIYH